MNPIAKEFCRKPAPSRSATIQTTLYDLVRAISEKIPPEEDALVADIVTHLLVKGKAKYVAGGGQNQGKGPVI